MEKLIINENNYRGYVSLYQAQQEQFFKRAFIRGVSYPTALLLLILGIFANPASLSTFVFASLFTVSLGSFSSIMIKTYYKKIRLNDLKEKYSYLDENIDSKTLEESLEKAGVMYRNVFGPLVDIRSYEESIKKNHESLTEERTTSCREVTACPSCKEGIVKKLVLTKNDGH